MKNFLLANTHTHTTNSEFFGILSHSHIQLYSCTAPFRINIVKAHHSHSDQANCRINHGKKTQTVSYDVIHMCVLLHWCMMMTWSFEFSWLNLKSNNIRTLFTSLATLTMTSDTFLFRQCHILYDFLWKKCGFSLISTTPASLPSLWSNLIAVRFGLNRWTCPFNL